MLVHVFSSTGISSYGYGNGDYLKKKNVLGSSCPIFSNSKISTLYE